MSISQIDFLKGIFGNVCFFSRPTLYIVLQWKSYIVNPNVYRWLLSIILRVLYFIFWIQEWNQEQWLWRSTLHSPKLQHYWSLTIRLFSIIYRTFVGGVLPLYRDTVGVFYSPFHLADWAIISKTLVERVLLFYRNAVHVFYSTPPPTAN